MVHFAAVTQNHLRQDTGGSGKVFVVCMVTAQNIAGFTQDITDITISASVLMPTSGAIQPTYRSQRGTGGAVALPGDRGYHICPGGGCAPTAVTAFPVTLQANGARDTLHFRRVSAFQYGTGATGTDDTGAGIQANLNVMFQCSGSITVQDTSSAQSGAVIATGVAETMINDYQQPAVLHGVGVTAKHPEPDYPAPVIPACPGDPATVWRGEWWDPSGVYVAPAPGEVNSGLTVNSQMARDTETIFDLQRVNDNRAGAVYDVNYISGPGCDSFGSEFNGLPPAHNGCHNLSAPVLTPFPDVPPYSYSSLPRIRTIVNGTNVTTSAFPQRLQSVPFLVNGGRPF